VNKLRRGEESGDVAPATTHHVSNVWPEEDLKEVVLQEDLPDMIVWIAKILPTDFKETLLGFHREYEDVFAWSPTDLQGVS
jgi:hypothetical protein